MPTSLGPLRLHIGLFGRQGAGKSSLLRALVRSQRFINTASVGFATDPLEKPLELPLLGPVQFVDTSHIREDCALGGAQAQSVLARVDLGIILTEAGAWGDFEQRLLAELKGRKVPVLVAFTKLDLRPPYESERSRLEGMGAVPVAVSSLAGLGLSDFREAMLKVAPNQFFDHRPLVADLVPPGGVAVLVASIDKDGTRGRPSPPQVMIIRDLLDAGSMAMIIQEQEIKSALDHLHGSPALVVTDAHTFLKVSAEVPSDIPMTTFSILMTRSSLVEHIQGALSLEKLRDGDTVLMVGTSGHHLAWEDIGRMKLPRWLRQQVGAKLTVDQIQGRDFPSDLSPYRLVIHGGDGTGNRRELISRVHRCQEAGVPITSDGLALAHSLGIFDRALAPFPEAHAVFRSSHVA